MNKKYPTLDRDSLPEDIIHLRGRHLKHLRAMTGLTVSALADKAGISRVTLTYWENANKSGLTRAGAEKIVQVLKKEKIECDINWLMFGTGHRPRFIDDPDDSNWQDYQESNIKGILPTLVKEIKIFLNSNKDAVIEKIKTSKMIPALEYGDIVGGIWQPADSLIIDKYCIIRLNNIQDVKLVKKTSNPKVFLISESICEKHPFNENTIEEVELSELAPIIRVWR